MIHLNIQLRSRPPIPGAWKTGCSQLEEENVGFAVHEHLVFRFGSAYYLRCKIGVLRALQCVSYLWEDLTLGPHIRFFDHITFHFYGGSERNLSAMALGSGNESYGNL
jgi:hypothetical protein